MANEYLRLQDTQMNIEKARNVIAVIEDKRKDDIKDVQSENNLFKELWKAFKNFFTKLGKPTLQKRLQKKPKIVRWFRKLHLPPVSLMRMRIFLVEINRSKFVKKCII